MEPKVVFGEVQRALGKLSKTTGAMRSKALLDWYEEEKKKGAKIGALELACALWTYEILPQYKFKPIPIKPAAVIEHEQIPDEDRQCLATSYYRARPEIKRHYELMRKVKVENKANYDWLIHCCKVLRDAKKIDEAGNIEKHIEGVSKALLL